MNEADALLATVKPDAVAALAGDPNWGANVELAKAQIAFAKHDYISARRHLDAAKPGFSIPKAEAYQVRAVTLLDAALHSSGEGGEDR
jgi:hypothetical protein